MIWSTRVVAACALTLVAAFAPSVVTPIASARVPSLESVAPPIGQIGSDFEATLVGSALTQFDNLLFYRKGVEVTGHEVISDTEVKVKLRALKDSSSGAYPFRVVTKGGISEVRSLTLSVFPVILESRKADDASEEQASMNIRGNCTIAGTLEDGEADRYTIEYAAGERISAEVQAVRLGGSLLDTVLEVFDPSGNRLLSVDDTPLFHQDPFVTLVAPTTGIYSIVVHEATYQGDASSWYALYLGSFPRPSFAFPSGLVAGQLTDIRLDGDAMGPLDQQVELPMDLLQGRTSVKQELLADENNIQTPTPLPIRLSSFPNSLEHEPNDAQADVRGEPAVLPMAFNGILERAGDYDYFKFVAEAGRQLQFEAFADQLGSPIDTRIAILDEAGNELAVNDDFATHDSFLEFQPPKSGVYWLRVTDKLANGDWNAVYRVEATLVSPELTVFLPRPDRRSQEKQTILVPRGNRSLVRLGVQRKHFESDTFCRFYDLPEGMRSELLNVPADRFWMPTVLEAEAKATLSGKLSRIEGSSQVDGITVSGGFKQVVDLVGGPADAIYHESTLDRVAVAVVEEVPFSIELIEPKTSLAIDGTLAIEIRVHRTDGFTGSLDVTFPLLPPMVDGPPKITIAGNEDRAFYTLHAHPMAIPREWPLVCEACVGVAVPTPGPSEPNNRGFGQRSKSTNDYGGISVCSQLAKLRIEASPVVGTIGVIAGEQGQTISAVCKLDCIGELPTTMRASMEGLPNRVHVAPIDINPLSGAATFKVNFEDTAPVGDFNDIVCKLTGTINGSEVSYFVGRSGTLSCVTPGGLFQNQSGRLLSPLEILRQQQIK